MSYRITLTNGTNLFDLADGVIDRNRTSVSLIGKNVVNYGEVQNENFVRLLENFAYGSSPANPLVGQLWFDTQSNSLKVYNNQWQSLAIVNFSDQEPVTALQGNLWFDTTTKQLKLNDGTAFNLIGPEGVKNFGTTRFVSQNVKDTGGLDHAVIKCTLNGEVIAVMSADDFDVLYTNAIDGIAHIYRGMTFKNSVQLYGSTSASSNAESLKSASGASYIPASISPAGNTIAQRNADGGITVSTVSTTILYSNEGTITGNWRIDSIISPLTSGGASLGTPDLRFAHVYSDSFDVGKLTSSGVSTAGTGTFETIRFTNSIRDPQNRSVTAFDTDATLSASSDSRLATQKAIKTYIDKAVGDAVAALNTTDRGLQDQITGVGLPVPAGSIFYHAGSSAPTGYLIANGSAVSKDTYFKLFNALGGLSSPYGQTGQTFNLPDLRGEFIRALDAGRGVDAGRTLGSVQSSSFASHTHNYVDTYYREFAGTGGNGPGEGSARQDFDNYDYNYDRTTAATGSNETRPRNIALIAIIKF
jgi:microcystin-dependent protein